MNPYLTFRISFSSSAAYQSSRHLMKHMSTFPITMLRSNYNRQHEHLQAKDPCWEFHVVNQLGGFRLLLGSVGRPCRPSPWWNTSTSTGINVGGVSPSTTIGWNFYICLLVRRISTYPGILHHVLRPSCKNSSGKGRRKCYPSSRISSYFSTSHRGLSEKPLKTSLPHDSSLDIL